MATHVVFPLVSGIVHPQLRGLAGWTIRETAGAAAEVTFRNGGPAGPVLAAVSLAANGMDDVLVGLGDYVSAPDGVYAAVTGSVEGALYAGRTERVNGFVTAMASTNPVAYWRLGEAAGTTAADATGNGHNGTYTNGPVLGQPGLIADTDTAVLFDGVDDRVAVPQHADLKLPGAVTVQAWIRPTALTAAVDIVRQGIGADTQYGILVDQFGTARFQWYDGAFKFIISPAGLIVADNTYHVVATRDASLFVRVYVDGVQVASGQGTAPTVDPAAMQISGASGVRIFPGTIDEPAVHNYVLTPEQVAGLYAAGVGS